MLILLIATHGIVATLLRRLSCLFRQYVANGTSIMIGNAQFDGSHR